MSNRWRTTFSIILGIIFILAGLMKLVQVNVLVSAFSQWNLSGWMFVIGAVEIASGLLFIFKKTAILGSFMLSSLLGGAIAIHLSYNQLSLVPIPAILLILVWCAVYVRKISLSV